MFKEIFFYKDSAVSHWLTDVKPDPCWFLHIILYCTFSHPHFL